MPSFSTPTDLLSVDDVIGHIITLNTGLRDFWGDGGWASGEAADLLSRVRLDWHVSLSHSLLRWIPVPTAGEEDAIQILAYSNIGALVEGTLKLFLSVWYCTYAEDADAIRKKGRLLGPDLATLELLRQFFKKRIWVNCESDDWDPWISKVQNRRNAIHAFKDRDIGVHGDIVPDIRNYLRLLRRINSQLPYPDGGYGPMETTPDEEFLCYLADDAAPTT